MRKIAAVLFSLLVQIVLYASSIATQKPGKDDSLAYIIAFTLSIIGSSLILERTRIDRFWKIFLLSCFAGFLPCLLYLFVVAIKFDYGIDGFAFVVLMFGILLTIAALCSLPFAAIIYRFRSPTP